MYGMYLKYVYIYTCNSGLTNLQLTGKISQYFHHQWSNVVIAVILLLGILAGHSLFVRSV